MAVNYYYNYAEIDPDTNMCIGIQSTSVNCDGAENLVRIESYIDDYVEKYYDWDSGKWYYDEAMTDEWIPPEN